MRDYTADIQARCLLWEFAAVLDELSSGMAKLDVGTSRRILDYWFWAISSILVANPEQSAPPGEQGRVRFVGLRIPEPR